MSKWSLSKDNHKLRTLLNKCLMDYRELNDQFSDIDILAQQSAEIITKESSSVEEAERKIIAFTNKIKSSINFKIFLDGEVK